MSNEISVKSDKIGDCGTTTLQHLRWFDRKLDPAYISPVGIARLFENVF